MSQKQQELLERYQDHRIVQAKGHGHDHGHYLGPGQGDEKLDENLDEKLESESEDELLRQLEEDEELGESRYREARLQQLSDEFRSVRQHIDDNCDEAGELVVLMDEKVLMQRVTGEEVAVVHFFHPNFSKCKIMNNNLKVLASKHIKLKFLAIEAVNAPFLVAKLDIKVLPFVILYKNAKEVDRLVGFEKLGNDPNNFDIKALERLLYTKNLIQRQAANLGSGKFNTVGVSGTSRSTESDDDLDI